MRSENLANCTYISENHEKLVDLKEIQLDESKSIHERMLDFLEKVRNPYLFRVGDMIVKVNFFGKESLQSKIEELILSADKISKNP